MHKQLYHFLNQCNIFHKLQFGVRLNTGTNQARISILGKIQTNLDDGKFSCGVFVDLTKSFCHYADDEVVY